MQVRVALEHPVRAALVLTGEAERLPVERAVVQDGRTYAVAACGTQPGRAVTRPRSPETAVVTWQLAGDGCHDGIAVVGMGVVDAWSRPSLWDGDAPDALLGSAGRIRNLGILDYRVPTTKDIPLELHALSVENADGPGPTGPFKASAKAACTAPALAASEVVVDLGLQGLGEHPAGAFTDQTRRSGPGRLGGVHRRRQLKELR